MIGAQGIGAAVLIFAIFLGFLILLYFAVIFKIINDKQKTNRWKVSFGLITPGMIFLGWIISRISGDGYINLISVFLLVMINLIYLLNPINKFLVGLIFKRGSRIVTTLLIGFISILSAFLIIAGLMTLIIYLIRN